MARPKIIEQPDVYAEDAYKMSFVTAYNVLHGKLSIQKANTVHRNMYDMNNAVNAAYKAQLNTCRNPRMKYFQNRPKEVVEEEKEIVGKPKRKKCQYCKKQ